MSQLRYTTPHGITVTRSASKIPYRRGLSRLLKQLDTMRGVYLSSGYEYPERYSRWDVASVASPIEIVGRSRELEIRALNERGEVLVALLGNLLRDHPHWEAFEQNHRLLRGNLKPLADRFPEEERSKQPSAFSILRTLIQEFRHPDDSRLALIGAFGYDLLLEFDPIPLRLPRPAQKHLHLFLCDDIYFMDRKREVIEHFEYDFSGADIGTTEGLPRTSAPIKESAPAHSAGEIVSDHTSEEYIAKVETVREGMRQGDYYEVVLRQTFSAPYSDSPSELFQRIQESSPSPYQFIIQMGDEQLIGASPEMFVRVERDRVETCPISGTARRSGDALLDAESIRELLNSTKEESELTMCSDVDRNDKSRVCVPGSVRVIGRRLIESYAALFHTVDHVTGTLMNGFDSLDAFVTHMWAVTVIGAPKKAAARAIEQLEKDARGWYGGAVGMISLNGDINTGILIRTVHLKKGTARYPAGATLLYDSDPASEDQECRLKASSFFRALYPRVPPSKSDRRRRVGERIRMLLVDNDDCFIHTLANYARQTGASVSTYRSNVALEAIDKTTPDIVLISPGPARPSDFGIPQLVQKLAERGVPVFGVCLGLQGIVEAFGGRLEVLGYPMHGKRSLVSHNGGGVFRGLPSPFRVGRYHSLYADRATFPSCLEITAESEDGIVMGIRHRSLPIEAVQFHPESLLTLERDCGLRLIENMIETYAHAAAALLQS